MDEKNIIIDKSHTGYTFIGAQSGEFVPQGETKPRAFFNMFVTTPFSESGTSETVGLKADKLRCLSADAWKGLKPGDKILAFFDRYGRVQAVDLLD